MAEVLTHENNNKLEIAFDGGISGGQEFPEVQGHFNSIVLKLSNVKYINSSGIKAWIEWKKRFLDNHRVEVIVEKCPECFIEQMNIPIEMLPQHAIIESFKAPYYVESDDTIIEVEFIRGEDYVGSEVKWEKVLMIDGKETEIDVDPEEYFMFLGDYK